MRCALLLVMTCMACGVAQAATVPVIVYHDVVRDSPADEHAVTVSQFREQMAYLKNEGYRPISLKTYIEAAHGRVVLPDKAVLLTFDDGLASFRDVALPVLVSHGFPAVLGIVTGWLAGEDVPEPYRGRLLTVEALREVGRSPWVEIVSHSDRLHQGIVADPQGSPAPAAVTRRYEGAGLYENESSYRSRVRSDLRASVERITAITGQRPRGIAWPYGLYNSILAEEAAALGMEAQLALDDHLADSNEYPRITRRLLRKTRTLADFETALQPVKREPPVRMIEIRLDDIAAAAPARQDAALRRMAERIALLRANMVIVHPFSANGRDAHFPNPSLPCRADILHRALYLLRHTAAVRELVLYLPANVAVDAVYTELARRHPFDGIVLAVPAADQAIVRIRDVFAHYRPGLRCGLEAIAPGGACRDFRLVVTGTRNTAGLASGEAPSGTAVYHLIRPEVGVDDAKLLDALRRLRRAGTLHFGLAVDGLLDDPEMIRRVAVEFSSALRRGPRG
jgi:biofilm PGA synthesis lipoprotein PgaB